MSFCCYYHHGGLLHSDSVSRRGSLNEVWTWYNFELLEEKRLRFHPCSSWSNETLNGLPHPNPFLLLKVTFDRSACVLYFLMFSTWGGLIPV